MGCIDGFASRRQPQIDEAVDSNRERRWCGPHYSLTKILSFFISCGGIRLIEARTTSPIDDRATGFDLLNELVGQRYGWPK
jgi:hypothetical protein